MSYPLEFFKYEKGILNCEGVSLNQIAKQVGTPAYVYSSGAMLAPLKELQQGLKNLDHTVCFALKSNSNIAVLNLLASAGAGMDLVSGGELYRAQMAKVPAEKIVFSGVGKSAAEMKMALEYGGSGIFSFNVESEAEVYALNEVALQTKKKARFAVRFNPDVDAKTHPYISTGLKKNKFGMQKAEIIQLAQNISQLKGVEFHGISIHIGSQLLSLSPLKDAFERLHKLVLEINSILKTPIQFVDLGGGVGITYKKEKAPSLDKYCALIQKLFGKKSGFQSPVKILIEPGRTISGNSGVLVTEVLFKKKNKAKDFLVVDAAMNDLIRPALYQSYHEIVPLLESQLKGARLKTDIVGPVCESADCFASDRPMPAQLKQGDLVAILSSGAYGFSMASNYNSRPRPPEVLVQGKEFKVIRDRETYADLIRGERL